MSLSKLSEFWMDDTGKLTDGTMEKVDCAISHDSVSQWKKITAPICRGDSFETHEGEVLQVSVPVQLKFRKGDAKLQRLRTAHETGEQQGILVSSGDKSEVGQNTLTFNALVETFTEKAQTGSHVIIDASFLPHAASTVEPVYDVVSA